MIMIKPKSYSPQNLIRRGHQWTTGKMAENIL